MLALQRSCFLISFMRQMSTKPKVTGVLEEKILQAIENNDTSARYHPGRIKTKSTAVPTYLHQAILNVLKDQPLKPLIEEGEKLDRYLKGRHPPLTPEELRQRNRHRKMYNWKPMDYEPHICLQYLANRTAPEFAILSRIFAELTTRVPEFQPKSIFDFGSGVGSVTWAALNTWRKSIQEVYCVDASGDMNTLADLLLKGGNSDGELPIPGIFFRQFLPASSSPQYDIVVSAFSLFELPSTQARLNTIHNLWSKTKHFLILVEQGTTAAFRLIDEAKEFVLYVSKTSEPGYTFAPCPHDVVCPRADNVQDRTPCNFEVKFPSLLEKRGNFQKERFTYVIMGKGSRPDTLPAWPRIVRQPLVRTKHSVCRLCTSEGKLQEIIFTASKDGKASYQSARSSEWGDLLPINIGTKMRYADKINESLSEGSKNNSEKGEE